MNKIKSLLRNFKARTVSFFKAPYHKFYQSLWDSIHDQTVSLVSDKLENDQDFLDLEEKVNDMNDSKLNTDDFDYELCNNYTFTELEERVDSLEANSDMDYATIGEESHPISRLIDARTEQIHSMIADLDNSLGGWDAQQFNLLDQRLTDLRNTVNVDYLVSELQKAVQDKADIAVFSYLVDSLANKVADNG